MPSVHSYLVFAALTQLQAGQDLTLYGLDPGIPFLHTLGLKVPSLASARYDEEVKIVLIYHKLQHMLFKHGTH